MLSVRIFSCTVFDFKLGGHDTMLRILHSILSRILSRITPEEIQVLIQQVMEVEINTEERLRDTIELI